ncbi:peptidoglycan-binding domain-containing protein [Streptomyces sp. NPDC057136]|uniref:peptidoglycan-binding domain-containing protein n=1 Tax=Streptomyces sp. NPDC057136 TaxID=3346029 RepID=UPI00362F6F9F
MDGLRKHWNGVKALQRALNRCYGGNLVVDGSFGNATRNTLVYAQGREGIAADGIYGGESSGNLRFPYYNDVSGAFKACA